jgi:AraC-like DNA-binding protein
MLISLIRAGDRKGARRLLNKMLGAIFLSSPSLVVVRALMIELMGYLVRAAVQDSPYLEPLMEKNHAWMARIIEAPEFEALSNVLRDALDDFMNNVYLLGYTPTNAAVRAALDFITRNFAEPVTLEQVAAEAGLSTYRIAHLVKESTGKTVIQHVHRRRIQEAQRLLEKTSMSCTHIAYAVGFGDQSYFIKQFRKLTGLTPGRHRRLYAVPTR